MSDWSSFLSRDELFGGLPARHASTLLYAIESRTAQLIVHSRQAMTSFLDEKTAEARERGFLEAMAQGRAPTDQPTIQDLERYAGEWAPLAPTAPGVRAALARMIGDKYVVPWSKVPTLRRALGLDDPEVADAFQRLHGRSLTSLYALRLPWWEPRPANSTFGVGTGLQAVDVDVPPTGARELAVWAHEITLDGKSQALPSLLSVQCGSDAIECDLHLGGFDGRSIMPMNSKLCRVHLSFSDLADRRDGTVSCVQNALS